MPFDTPPSRLEVVSPFLALESQIYFGFFGGGKHPIGFQAVAHVTCCHEVDVLVALRIRVGYKVVVLCSEHQRSFSAPDLLTEEDPAVEAGIPLLLQDDSSLSVAWLPARRVGARHPLAHRDARDINRHATAYRLFADHKTRLPAPDTAHARHQRATVECPVIRSSNSVAHMRLLRLTP